MQHLQSNNLITKNQHGFIFCRSCMTQQVETLNEWSMILEDNQCVDVKYLEIKKAYTVPHNLLLLKLKKIGHQQHLIEMDLGISEA